MTDASTDEPARTPSEGNARRPPLTEPVAPSGDAVSREHGDVLANPPREAGVDPAGPVIDSLMAVFAEKGSGLPKRFLGHLVKTNAQAFDPADVESTLLVVDDADPELKRLRFLVRTASRGFGGDFKQPALDFARRAIRDDIEGSDLDDVTTSPAARLESVVGLLRPRVRDNGPVARRAFNVMMLTIEILAAGTTLQFEDVTPVLRRALVDPDATEAGANLRRARLGRLSDPNLTVDSLRQLLEVMEPSEMAAAEARRAAAEAQRASESMREERDAAQLERNALQQQLANLSEASEQQRQELARLRDQVRDAGALGQSDVAAARARELSLLQGKLRPMLDSVREAGELEPPRTAVIRRYVADVLREIDKEIGWLKSSD